MSEARPDAPEQLPLNIGLRDHASFANFYPGRNGQVLAVLKQRTEPFVYLWGPPGSGRSHLLQAACQQAGRQGQQAAYLPLGELLEHGPGALEGLEQMDLVCLDDLERIAADAAWEEALFHLYNRVRDAGHHLVAAAVSAPHALGLALGDLVSRLGWGPVFRLEPLDDEEKQHALRQRAASRGIGLPADVSAYLLRHYHRDLPQLFALLDTLDEASLRAQRRLTVPFIKSVLARSKLS